MELDIYPILLDIYPKVGDSGKGTGIADRERDPGIPVETF
jgi:hypothetical protein